MCIPRRPGARLAAIAVLLTVAALAPGGVTAANCTGNSHALVLSDGTVSPGSGNTSTTFTFAVTYADSGGCAPDRIVVAIEGVGDVNLKHASGSLVTGALFKTKLDLPAGRRSYIFEATSGSGPGLRTVKFKNVDPPDVVVSAPNNPPPAEPTPAPTPKPGATPAPEHTEAPTATPGPSRRPGPAGSEHPDASISTTHTPASTAEPREASTTAFGRFDAGHGGDPSPGATAVLDEAPRLLLALLVASLGTVVGLILFAILSSWLADPIPSGSLAAAGRRGRAPTAPGSRRGR